MAHSSDRQSVAEEQPQQKDHRNWHAQHPKQKSSSHSLILHPRLKRANAGQKHPFLKVVEPEPTWRTY
jgi:hypothetical protein